MFDKLSVHLDHAAFAIDTGPILLKNVPGLGQHELDSDLLEKSG